MALAMTMPDAQKVRSRDEGLTQAPGIVLARARPEDAPAMLDLQRRAFAEEGRRSGDLTIPPLAESLPAIAAHIADQTAITARRGETIIGAIRGVVADRVCTIRALVVDPAEQGQGIGFALLEALERAVADVLRFELITNTVMERNVAFYERHGYRVAELTRHSDKVVLAHMTKDAPVGIG